MCYAILNTVIRSIQQWYEFFLQVIQTLSHVGVLNQKLLLFGFVGTDDLPENFLFMPAKN